MRVRDKFRWAAVLAAVLCAAVEADIVVPSAEGALGPYWSVNDAFKTPAIGAAPAADSALGLVGPAFDPATYGAVTNATYSPDLGAASPDGALYDPAPDPDGDDPADGHFPPFDADSELFDAVTPKDIDGVATPAPGAVLLALMGFSVVRSWRRKYS